MTPEEAAAALQTELGQTSFQKKRSGGPHDNKVDRASPGARGAWAGMEMTREFLRKHLREHKQYTTFRLNDKLFLNNKVGAPRPPAPPRPQGRLPPPMLLAGGGQQPGQQQAAARPHLRPSPADAGLQVPSGPS